ncbi:MAG: molybdopterin molybdenumtransferase MoeA, partial [Sphingobium sp.]
MSLMPVADAQARLLALADPLPAEHVPVATCAGRWLAADISALRDQPWADLSAMDGYAVRASEGAGPWQLVATSSAGDADIP